jgi:hypothetical protein
MTHIVLALLAGALGGAPLVALVAWLAYRRTRRCRATALVAPEERADRLALRRVREAAAMLDFDDDGELRPDARETDVSFYLYFASRVVAERAAAQVATLRLETHTLWVPVEPAARGASWLCLVSTRIVPTEVAIRRACAELRAIAEACGGEFDGWRWRSRGDRALMRVVAA